MSFEISKISSLVGLYVLSFGKIQFEIHAAHIIFSWCLFFKLKENTNLLVLVM